MVSDQPSYQCALLETPFLAIGVESVELLRVQENADFDAFAAHEGTQRRYLYRTYPQKSRLLLNSAHLQARISFGGNAGDHD